MDKQKFVYLILSAFMVFFIVISPSFCFSEIFFWEDKGGIKHYTDNTNSIPSQYRDKAKIIYTSKQKEELYKTPQKKIETPDKPKNFKKKRNTVKLRQSGNSLIVAATLNGSEPAIFVVDTGASITTISRKVASKLNINNTLNSPKLAFSTANGIIEAPLVKLESIKLGETILYDVMATIHDAAPGYTGLLGLSFLNEFNYSINPMDKILILDSLEDPNEEKIFGGHGRKWWQRKFRSLKGFKEQQKKNMEKLRELKPRITTKKERSLIKQRIETTQINIDYFQKELKTLENKATLAMVPIQWLQ